ncbi:hypothetical protein [Tellurirhabdus bombi]|uniref:hypothetical protein n=1 Tax=Tellurirhabdus bombi TaxID=2907205 RepID=UPI001F3F9C30|nr:hypothetical protein [Tellurirhabdus bombi]
MHPEFKKSLERGEIEPAILPDGTPFVRDEITYYQATQGGINMYMGRFHSFSDVLRKHDALKISSELMDTAQATKADLLKQALLVMQTNPGQAQDCIREVLTIEDRINQRREFGLDVNQVYEISSIWYFSEEEDPAVIDKKTNKRKIESWMEFPELYGFFLRTLVGSFVPLSALVDKDILEYIQNLNLLEQLDLSRIALQYRTAGLKSGTNLLIASRLETLNAYENLIDLLSRNTTSILTHGSETEPKKEVTTP